MITLYKKDTAGKIRGWDIEQTLDCYSTRDYLENGKVKEWVHTKCKGKNIGKSNVTTDIEQAELELNNLVNKKLKDGYFYTKEEALVDNSFSKMLAHPLEKYPKNLVFPYYMSNKLDGVASNPINGEMISRNGRPFTSCPHIVKALEKFALEYPDIVLCGELYSHEYHDKFDELISIIRTQKPSKKDLDLSERYLKYHVYDLYNKNDPGLDVLSRLTLLYNICEDYFKEYGIIIYEGSVTVNNQSEADSFHMSAIEAGYEGTMIRTQKCLYEPGKRSSNLLKRKDFITEEYTIVDIIEGNGAWQGKAKEVQINVKGKNVGCGIRGSFDFCKDLLQNKEKYKNTSCTVRHFGETCDGSLRFGVVVAIRDYE